MFERFTDRARRVVVLATDEARSLGDNSIRSTHILLGLLTEDGGTASQVLHELRVHDDDIREYLMDKHGSNPPTSGHIPYTAHTKKILELSLREALQLGHNYIGTEHILLGLVRARDDEASEYLVSKGIDLAQVQQAVIQKLTSYGSPDGARPLVSFSLTDTRANMVVEWLHEYRKMFGPLAHSHPAEILWEAFAARTKK